MLLEMTNCFEMDGEHVSDEFHLVLTNTTGCTGASITAQIKENIPWLSDCVMEMTEGNGRLCQHRFPSRREPIDVKAPNSFFFLCTFTKWIVFTDATMCVFVSE